MKATHTTQDGKKVSKIKVEFIVTNEDIILAIDKLISFGDKITKKSIEEQIYYKFKSIGDGDDTDFFNYEEALELAMKLYPDYF